MRALGVAAIGWVASACAAAGSAMAPGGSGQGAKPIATAAPAARAPAGATDAGSSPAGSVASAASPSGSSGTAGAGAPAQAPERPVVAFETPYKLGSRPRLRDPDFAKRDARSLARWNAGGRDGTWHPEPRVMVDRLEARGRIDDALVLREVRRRQYGPIRRCYDAALARDPGLQGRMRVQLNVAHTGAVRAPKAVGKATLADADLVDCVVRSFAGLRVSPTRRGAATVSLDVALHPGDAPVRPSEDPAPTPGTGVVDAHRALAAIVGAARGPVEGCYERGRARVSGLWGRMALRLDVAPDGVVRSVQESESLFPDPETTRCASEALRLVPLPPPQGGEVRLVVPIRFGTPPSGTVEP